MDGTVLNTVEDLQRSVDWAMNRAGYKVSHTPEQTLGFFGSGIHVALQRAFASDGIEVSEEEIDRVQALFAPYYKEHCAEKTDAYPGIRELLVALRKAGVKTAVVSNKLDGPVQELTKQYFDGLFDLSVGEKPGIRRKPAPDMTLHVLEKLGIEAGRAVYIGDSEVDLETARNSGMDCIAVSWGFRGETFLKEQGASCIVSDPAQILEMVTR